jgi:PIN domain nuclease of toxin-antitoxin system
MTVEHAFKVGELPPHHRDPFDRLLIAQSLVDGLTLVTGDSSIRKYDVPILQV